ncbi:MAG: glycyl-radical enzyme activating protein [Anaerolineaceae bacterium]|nr:glycyl-radical enzyme activating protein [Anaerolineaceae bacterium]
MTSRREGLEETTRGWILNLQRFSVHDGPGIRTTVFLKGCPLRCLWCDNPESQCFEPQILFWEDRCIRCGACVAVCPEGAVIEVEGRRRIDDARCTTCGQCVAECYAGALEQVGRLMTAEEVLAEVEADRPFYEESGGGMTLSGGEPTAQPAFARALLAGAKARHIHTAIESCGYAPWDVWEELLPFLDLILYDVKEVDPALHQELTGVSSEPILDNLARLARSGKPLIVRRPVIPGYNDSPESIHRLARAVRELGTVEEIDLLPYHRMGEGKYDRLEQEYALHGQVSLKEEDVAGLRDILLSYGFRVKIGG